MTHTYDADVFALNPALLDNFRRDVVQTECFSRDRFIPLAPVDTPYRPVTRDCITAAEVVTGISGAMIRGRSRTHEVAEARQIAMVLAIDCGYSPSHIGRKFRKDRTTVLYAAEKMQGKPLLMQRAQLALREITESAS